jgi:hypothetical protein
VLDHILSELGWERGASAAADFDLSVQCRDSIDELNEQSFLHSYDSFNWLKSLARLEELRPDRRLTL